MSSPSCSFRMTKNVTSVGSSDWGLEATWMNLEPQHFGTIFSDQPNWRWFGIISGRNYKCVLLCDSWANRIVGLSSFPPHGTAARASRPRRCRSFSFSVAWGWCSKTLHISLSASLAMRALVPLGVVRGTSTSKSQCQAGSKRLGGLEWAFRKVTISDRSSWRLRKLLPASSTGPLLANSWRSLPSILAPGRLLCVPLRQGAGWHWDTDACSPHLSIHAQMHVYIYIYTYRCALCVCICMCEDLLYVLLTYTHIFKK